MLIISHSIFIESCFKIHLSVV
jgi:hypothetical protein